MRFFAETVAHVAVFDRHGFFMYSRRMWLYQAAKFAERAERWHGLTCVVSV